MTRIRTLFIILLCSLATSGAFAENAGGWYCEASDNTINLSFSDDIHAHFLGESDRPHPPATPFTKVAAAIWDALWTSEHVKYEIISETVVRFIRSSASSSPEDKQEITCKKLDAATDI